MHGALLWAAFLAHIGDRTRTTAALPNDSIHRLAPAAFRQLPVSVRRDLERRGCLVPQPWNRPTPTNVIRGAFTRASVVEWAVLCSVRESSQVLIYRRGPSNGAHVVDSLARSPDSAWVQGIGEGRWGYSRLIKVRPRQRMSGWRVDVDQNRIPQPIDHDAIEQDFLEKTAEAFYFARGRWYRQITAD
jgi:hypothetical protein